MSLLSKVADRVQGLPSRPRELSRSLQLMGELRTQGWHRSMRGGGCSGPSGQPIPWITYGALYWLESVLRPHHRVFEFGSGNSTLWFAERVKSVVSVEHDPRWVQLLRPRLPANAELRQVTCLETGSEGPPGDLYSGALRETPGDFDLVVVDGRVRNTCVRVAAEFLSEDGLVLLDDSERVAYRSAHRFLADLGFCRLDFIGPKPATGFQTATSIFGRNLDAWMRDLDPPRMP